MIKMRLPLLRFRQWLNSFWQDLPLATKGVVLNALPLTVLLASLVLIFKSEQQAALLEARVQNALQTQQDIQTLHTELLEASTGVRDYLLTANPHSLDGYLKTKVKLPKIVDTLNQQLDDPTQQQLLVQIRPLLKQNLDDLAILASHTEQVASDALIRKFASQTDALNQLRQLLERMQEREAQLLAIDKQEIIQEREHNLHITIMAFIAGVLGSLIGVWIFSNTLVNRVKTIRDSAMHLVRGEPLALPDVSRDELGQLTEELEHTSQLLSQRAQETHQARVEAEEANKAKSQFLSRTSHELRTPLNAIIGFAQILETDLPEGRQKDSATLIHNAGQHLLKLINGVLDISRIESGDIAMALEVIPLTPLLAEACDYIKPLGRVRDVVIETRFAQDLFVQADRQRLMQVVLNLLTNALKYGPENSTVICSAYADGDQVRIEVLDQGAGISPALRSRLFTPFDRLGAERTMTEGTGLGLVLSKELMTAMGGEIGIAENQSLFWVSLPAASATASKSTDYKTNTADSLSVANPDSKIGNKQHVLYVEDHASNRALMEAIMSKHRHIKLHLANSVQEALIWLRDMTPDMLLIDLNLPDGSGEQLVRHAKSQPALQHIPIMVLSADASSETIQRVQALGIDQYFTKPINVSTFNQLIQQYLSQGK